MARFKWTKWSAFLREDLQPYKTMTDTLTPVEYTNWALLAWNSTLDWNDVPSAWLYGQDHLCGQLVTSCLHLESFSLLPRPPPRPCIYNAGLKLMHMYTFEKIVCKGLKSSKELNNFKGKLYFIQYITKSSSVKQKRPSTSKLKAGNFNLIF